MVLTNGQTVFTQTGGSLTTTNATGPVQVIVNAGDFTQNIHASFSPEPGPNATITNRSVADAQITAVNIAPEILYTDIGASRTELDVAALIMEVKLALFVIELKTLSHVDIHLGDHADFHVGAHIDLCVGTSTQVVVGTSNTAVAGAEVKIHLGPSNELAAGEKMVTAGMFSVL